MKRILAIFAVLPSPALAHGGHMGHEAFLAGLTHPLGGADHLFAMVAVGLWAATLGGRGYWLLPTAFVVAMALGGSLGAMGLPLPGVEPGILASILVIGGAVSLAVKAHPLQAAAIVSFFGLLHGHAHGVEGPSSELAVYAAGFVLTSMALHLLGLLAGRALHAAALRAAGGATVLGALALAIGG